MPCLDEEQLEALAGPVETAPAPLEEAWAHLRDCAACSKALARRREDARFLQEVRQARLASGARTDRTGIAFPEIPGYELLREIHRGGQGIVYEGVQLSTRRRVAIKILLHGAFAGQRDRWRFEREARLIANLEHPGIVAIYDSGVALGRYYLAMALIDGIPLDEFVEANRLNMRPCVSLFSRVCDAVAHAHVRGIVHRDLKPSNILVSADGTPHVLDFGLAKLIKEDSPAPDPSVSSTGAVVGTLAYMSPEQTRGQSQFLDVRSDVYTLGVILFRLLTGQHPYELPSEPAGAIHTICEAMPQRASKLSPQIDSEMEAILFKTLEKNPEHRYRSAGELAEDLRAWLERRPVSVRSTSSLYVLRKMIVRNRGAAALIASVSVLVISSATIGARGWLWGNWSEERRQESVKAAVHAEMARDTLAAQIAPGVEASARQAALGWFLCLHQLGQVEPGARIGVPEDSPEGAVIRFLTDETYGFERLQERLGEDEALLYFAAGERALRNGRRQEAIAAYEAGTRVRGGQWSRWAAGGRLRQLRGGAEPNSEQDKPLARSDRP